MSERALPCTGNTLAECKGRCLRLWEDGAISDIKDTVHCRFHATNMPAAAATGNQLL